MNVNATTVTDDTTRREPTGRFRAIPAASTERAATRFNTPATLSDTKVALVNFDEDGSGRYEDALRRKVKDGGVVRINYTKNGLGMADVRQLVTDLEETKPDIILVPFCSSNASGAELFITEARKKVPFAQFVTIAIDGDRVRADLKLDKFSVKGNGSTAEILERELGALLTRPAETLARTRLFLLRLIEGGIPVDDAFHNDLWLNVEGRVAEAKMTVSATVPLPQELTGYTALVITSIPPNQGAKAAEVISAIRASGENQGIPIIVIGNAELDAITDPSVVKIERIRVSTELILFEVARAASK